MKLLFTLIIICSVILFSCEDPSLERFELNEAKESVTQPTSEWEGCTIYIQPEPEFPGGVEMLIQFIENNFRFPDLENACIVGTIVVSLKVELDGSLQDVKIIRSIHPLLDAEAIRVVQSMPPWIPGTFKGMPVATWVNLPVRVTLH